MGLMDRLWRKRTMHLPNPIGMGVDSDEEPGEGGPSIYQPELAELRWAATSEALNIARRGVDPERWDDARMQFEFERGIAHDHEALRDRLASYVGDQVREVVSELYEIAAEVGTIGDELRTVDDELVHVTKAWRDRDAEVADDELESSRYWRLRSASAKNLKWGLAAVFVIAELFITGYVFDVYFEDLPPGAGFILSLGTTLALIVIPHYSALGLKEGMTNYHLPEKQELEEANKAVPKEVERAVAAEAADDRGFRLASVIVGALLVLAILPLSYLRTTGESGEFRWGPFLFFLLIQYVLSGYFFLREWLDHGHPSHSLDKIREERDRLKDERAGILEDYTDAARWFYARAEDLVFVVQQAPRWDSHIVESYNATLDYMRHVIAQEHPEAEQFIVWASKPYLGSESSVGEASAILAPTSNEHASLDEQNVLGREWWMRTAGDALTKATGEEVEPDSAGWLLNRSPDQILTVFLDRFLDLPLKYTRPADLDDEDADADEGEALPAPLRLAGDTATPSGQSPSDQSRGV